MMFFFFFDNFVTVYIKIIINFKNLKTIYLAFP